MESSSIKLQRCRFTFVSERTLMLVHVIGIERTWEELKETFNRKSDGLPDSSARYFETIGCGPFLFAACGDGIYYHHEEQWSRYRSATDIKYDTITIEV